MLSFLVMMVVIKSNGRIWVGMRCQCKRANMSLNKSKLYTCYHLFAMKFIMRQMRKGNESYAYKRIPSYSRANLEIFIIYKATSSSIRVVAEILPKVASNFVTATTVVHFLKKKRSPEIRETH